MLFSSFEFLFLFLPLTVGVYFLLPRRAKNAWLLISGLCFYAFGGPEYLPLMMWTVLADFLLGRLIVKRKAQGRDARAVLIIAVVLNIGQLALFKYFDPLGWGLPIGISFYTFQTLSYVIDVYRGDAEESRSIVDFGAYAVLFPQLIAGPIVRYSDVDAELRDRRHSLTAVSEGMRRFCAGLAKKVLLADTAGEVYDLLCTYDSSAGAALAVVFFSFQIYFDFSGYSDMALGLGRVLGFSFPENFNYPYICESITDFWRRWHMTLSGWFREYVYIPLGGNRRGRARTYLNLLITWSLTGIWHGADINFLLWGAYFALVLIAEKAFLLKLIERSPRAMRHIYALSLVFIGWVIFALDKSSALSLGALFGGGADGLWSDALAYEALRSAPSLIIMALGCTPWPRRMYLKIRERFAPIDIILPLAGLVLSLAYIAGAGYGPFLYFRF